MLENMTQEQKDALLTQLLAKQQQEERRKKAQDLGLGWSKNGFITLRQGKLEDKNLPAHYIHPSFLGKLESMMPTLQAFASDQEI